MLKDMTKNYIDVIDNNNIEVYYITEPIGFYDNECGGAAAMKNNYGGYTIYLSNDLVNNATEHEIRCVLSHEVAHCKMDDSILQIKSLKDIVKDTIREAERDAMAQEMIPGAIAVIHRYFKRRMKSKNSPFKVTERKAAKELLLRGKYPTKEAVKAFIVVADFVAKTIFFARKWAAHVIFLKRKFSKKAKI